MPVAATHQLCLVADDAVDDPLMDALVSERRNEAVAEDMVAAQPSPFRRTGKRIFEMIMRFVACQKSERLSR